MRKEITKLDLFNLALHQQHNGLVFQGFKVGSYMFAAGIMKAIEDLEKKFEVTATTKSSNLKQLIFNRLSRLLKRTLETKKYREFINKFTNIPFVFYPKYTHTLDGHKLVMWDGEPDLSIRNILKEYRDLAEWEPKTSEMIKKLAKDSVCIDIGASIGPLTLLMCKEAKQVIAVEPTERCFRYLVQNLEANGYTNCISLRFAAWDKNEVVKMPINDPNPNYVNGICMDDWLEWNGISNVDFIKIDVDGSEPRVLQGLLRTFERNSQLKMVIEYYPLYMVGGGQDPDRFMEIINKYFNYKIIDDTFSDGCWQLYCERK